MHDEIVRHLRFLYGDAAAEQIYPRLVAIVKRCQDALTAAPTVAGQFFSQEDAVLIAYGDMVQAPYERPLQTLDRFLADSVGDSINTVHILPFFPYSSDDGFSVIDYKQVDPDLGEWADIECLRGTFRLMFDAVINHVSARSRWFEGFLRDEDPYRNYFIDVPADANLSQVFRPRALPLLSEVQTATGAKHVWTTFSADQIDLNFANPEVLLEMLDTLLFYVERGASIIRLDAVAYIWKEMNSTCIHLPQTHRIIQLMRAVLDIAAPYVVLITETNVPHEDNISYFGDGDNEAQMVYNFSLPPLTLHAFHKGDATVISDWAASLTLPSPRVGFFNFLASHDGIGLTPARGLLPEEDVREIATRVQQLGGYVSYRTDPDGGESPYELNISYIDALGRPGVVESDDMIARRFLSAQGIMLSLRGVPGIYFHSLYGSRSWHEGVLESGQKRRINRQKLQRKELEAALADRDSLRARVFYPYTEMLRIWAEEEAFHPSAEQEVVRVHSSLFALWRRSQDGTCQVLCLHNVSDGAIDVDLDLSSLQRPTARFIDLLSGAHYIASGDRLALEIPPYGVRWLRLHFEQEDKT